MIFPSFKKELRYRQKGYVYVLGCDEAGRGPVAGPVVAAACVLDPESISARGGDKWYARVRDSKTVPEPEREILAEKIKKHALAYGIGVVSEQEVDRLNIHHATLLAMRRAVERILPKIARASEAALLIDGSFTIPGIALAQEAVKGGDALVLSIAAASIIAKTHRDAIMRELDQKFPEYGFRKHKGYKTREHAEALRKWGPSAVHRKTFVK